MTRISPNRTRYPLQRYVGLIVGVIVVLGVVILLRFPLGNSMWGVGVPLLQARQGLVAISADWQAQFMSKTALMAQNQALQAALASSTAALADRNALYQETLDLKSRLGRDGNTPVILGAILIRPPALPYDTLLIDAGTNDGVATGDMVASGGTTLIGFISQADRSVSYVTLFSAPDQTYNALLHTQQGSIMPIVITGEGGGALMGKVPSGTTVAPGDTIVFPSIVGGFIGTVSAVDAPANQSFENVYLHEPVNIEELEYVEVWKHA